MPKLNASASKFTETLTISKRDNTKVTINTTNTFVDKDIELTLNVRHGAVEPKSAVVSSGLSPTDNSNGGINIYPEMGTGVASEPTTGYFIAVNTTGTTQNTVSTAGWMPQGDLASISTSNTTYYPIDEGEVTVVGGDLVASTGSTSLVSSGLFNGTDYDTTDKIDITSQATEATGYYKLVASGSGQVIRQAITKQVTDSGYVHAQSSSTNVSNQTSLSSNTATAEYYIQKSTLSANTITPSITQQTVTISAGYYPTSRTVTVEAEQASTLTTNYTDVGMSSYFDSLPNSTNANVTITPTYTNTAGYLDAHTDTNAGGIGYWKIKTSEMVLGTSTVSGDNLLRGNASWDTGWIIGNSIAPATFSNVATSGTTYLDVTDTTGIPVLDTEDGYLYINKGYVDDFKIHIGKFISSDVTIQTSDQILASFTAYDEDGILLTGTIPSLDVSSITRNGAIITIPWGKYETTVGQHDDVIYTIPTGDYEASAAATVNGSITPSVQITDASSYGFTALMPVEGEDGVNYLTINPGASVTTAWAATATATITTAGYLDQGSKTDTVTGTPGIENGDNYYIPIVTPTFDGGVVSASATNTITTTMNTSNAATAYYVDASAVGSATRTAVTYSNDAGAIAAHNGATALDVPEEDVKINSAADRVYIPVAIGAVNMTAGTGVCEYNETNSANVTVSDTNTSGVAIAFSGSGSASATAAITTAGYAAETASFAEGTSTSSSTVTATKYLTGVTLVAPSEGTRYFDITVPNGNTSDFITFRFTVDTAGNVTVAGPD